MPIFILDNTITFPPTHLAEADGLLAMGGDLSTERLLHAYKKGIFPWYNDGPILWWSPDPRFVLFPNELKIHKNVRKLIRNNVFTFTINKAFASVIRECKNMDRAGQDGTWITTEVMYAFIKLHELGHAHSAEVWLNNELVGGVYGIRMGNVFFGESMFSKVSNASRYAFVHYVQHLVADGVELIDCQVYTEYLESLGAKMIERSAFERLIAGLI